MIEEDEFSDVTSVHALKNAVHGEDISLFTTRENKAHGQKQRVP